MTGGFGALPGGEEVRSEGVEEVAAEGTGAVFGEVEGVDVDGQFWHRRVELGKSQKLKI